MGWSVGYDTNWKRDIGYGVPAKCDHPGCEEEIDRGLSYVCADQEPYGGERGCGLYFCMEHQHSTEKHSNLCVRCLRGNQPFTPKQDVPEWINHKLTDESWQQWRDENPAEVAALSAKLVVSGARSASSAKARA